MKIIVCDSKHSVKGWINSTIRGWNGIIINAYLKLPDDEIWLFRNRSEDWISADGEVQWFELGWGEDGRLYALPLGKTIRIKGREYTYPDEYIRYKVSLGEAEKEKKHE